MPTLALGMLLCDQANLQCKLSDKLFIISVKEDIQKILDDGTRVLRASDDKEQIQGHNTNEEIVLTEALKDGGFVALNNLQVVLGHEIEVKQREILGVCILDRDEFSQNFGNYLLELRIFGLEQHEALETFEKYC